MSYPTGSLHTELCNCVSSDYSFRSEFHCVQLRDYPLFGDTVHDKSDPIGFIFVLADDTICATAVGEA